MDSKSILKACKSEILKSNFKGFLFCNKRTNEQIGNHNIGDFYIVNTDGKYGGQHWFCIVRGYDMWIIYDCTMMTPEFMYESIISRLKMPCIIDRKQLEGINSLLCGEFSIVAAGQMSKILIRFGNTLTLENYPKDFYSKNLLKYANSLKISPDAFVFDYVYHKLKKVIDIHPESKKDVLYWLNDEYRSGV